MAGSMAPERWEKLKQIFQASLDLAPSERAAYVVEASQGDETLRTELESLLQSEEQAGAFLSAPAAAYVGSDLEDPPADAIVGRGIGPYQVVREIGRGGMGTVYLAERVGEFRQKVAIKLMLAGLDSRAVAARFRHERQILASLDHPQIARLLDGGTTDDGRPYFVMEYVDGTAIDAYVAHRGLGIPERLALFLQVCKAVDYAHRNLVVHRDIKPANILVTADGVIKLMDFGIAKVLGEGDTRETTARTRLGMRIMTPEYASPEQARGSSVTTATDVYSLGAVLYELLTGKLPYEIPRDSPGEIERVICETEPRPPSTAIGGAAGRRLAGDLDTIALKALNKEPEGRYGSVEQLSADIERHLAGEPIQARPQTFVYRTGRLIRRNRLATAATALVLVSLCGGLAATAWEARIAQRERRLSERRFNDVRQLAHDFLFDFHDSIKNLPGSTAARQLVVDKALQYLNRLSSESGNDAGLVRELAEAYLRVGDVQGDPGSSNLGDTPGALRSYQRALALGEDAARRNPSDLEAQRFLARAHDSVGTILQFQMHPSDAVPHYREAVRIIVAVASRAPRRPEVLQELSSAYEVLGDGLGNPGYPNVGDAPGAKQAYEKARSVSTQLSAEQPDNKRARRAIGVMGLKLADIELGSGEVEAAVADYRRAASALEAASAADPLNAGTTLILGVATEGVGSALEAGGQWRAALTQYEKASAIQRGLLEADPKNGQARNAYTLLLGKRAALLYPHGDPSVALALYREQLDVLQPLLVANPNSVERRSRRATALVTIGRITAGQGKREAAAGSYREGLATLKALADRSEATPNDQSAYAEQLLTCPLAEFADSRRALDYAKRAAAMSHESNAAYLELLARAYDATGDSAAAAATEQKLARFRAAR